MKSIYITDQDIKDIGSPYVLLSQSKVDFNLNCIYCGLKSNIPFCCILFFLIFWKPIFILVHFKIVQKFIHYYPPRTYCDFCYIPCFFCLMLRKCSPLKTCNYQEDSDCCCYKQIT